VLLQSQLTRYMLGTHHKQNRC